MRLVRSTRQTHELWQDIDLGERMGEHGRAVVALFESDDVTSVTVEYQGGRSVIYDRAPDDSPASLTQSGGS